MLADGNFKGKVAPPLPATPDTNSVTDGIWNANLPTAGGLPGATTSYRGTSDPTATPTAPSTTLPASACVWDANAFYNPKQVVSYQGQFYTASQAVVPFGSAGAAIFNPAVNSSSWISGGSSCGPTPFVKVDSAVCTKGVSADVITITGTAYGGGIGDAIAAYTNVTDRSFSNENNFGLPGTSYSMTCKFGGFSGSFASTTSPSYSVCVKTTTSNEETSWTSAQTVPHSTTLNKFTTAYASKGSPLRATVFNVGSIVMGLDAVRSPGVAITGNCL